MIDLDKYQDCLKEAGKLKAYSDSVSISKWDRIVACHQAAYLEVSAIDFLGGIPTETIASHLAEAIALYVGAYDPVLARIYLSKLQYIAEQVGDNQYVQDVISGISSRVLSAFRSYENNINKLQLNHPFIETPIENLSIKEMDRVLDKFPGVSNLWWIRHFYCTRHNQISDAKVSLTKARLLSPDNDQLSATFMLFVANIEPTRVALDLCRSELGQFANSALVNITFAIAVLHAHRGKIRRSVLREAVDALLRGREFGASDFDEAITTIASAFATGQDSDKMTTTEKIDALLRIVGRTETKVAVTVPADSGDVIQSAPIDLGSWMSNKFQANMYQSLLAA